MFEILNPRQRESQPMGVYVSVAIHGLFFVWLLWSFRPNFVKVNSVAHGTAFGAATIAYLPSSSVQIVRPSAPLDSNAALSQLKSSKLKLSFTTRSKRAIPRARTTQSLKVEATQDLKSHHGTASTLAGSVYGSLASGATLGLEIRPALWISGSDPALPPNELRGVDDTIVVEISIDERGNIISKTVLHSLGSEIDNKVLAALENWRFLPARRDGVPIASKQDVHFHFGGKARS